MPQKDDSPERVLEKETIRGAIGRTILAGIFLWGGFIAAANCVSYIVGLPPIFWLVVAAGALGGLIESLIRHEGEFVYSETRIATSPRRVVISGGTIGDALIGTGGALTLAFLFGSGLLGVNLERPSGGNLILLGSVSFVAGVVARPLIQTAGELLLARAVKQAEQAKDIAVKAQATTYLAVARVLIIQKELSEALRMVDKALDIDPENVEGLIEKARVLKRLAQKSTPPDPKQMEEALRLTELATKLKPSASAAWYNMACYEAIAGRDTELIYKHLRVAFRLDPSLKAYAWSDEDLIGLHGDPQFEDVADPRPTTVLVQNDG